MLLCSIPACSWAAGWPCVIDCWPLPHTHVQMCAARLWDLIACQRRTASALSAAHSGYGVLCLQEPCNIGSIKASTCMHGFSIQGNFEPARRNYTRLWHQMEQAMTAGTIPTEPPVRPLHLHLVGRGDVNMLKMPKGAQNHTTVHVNLKFQEYYDQVWQACQLLTRISSCG